jgi:hypothetical protein
MPQFLVDLDVEDGGSVTSHVVHMASFSSRHVSRVFASRSRHVVTLTSRGHAHVTWSRSRLSRVRL